MTDIDTETTAPVLDVDTLETATDETPDTALAELTAERDTLATQLGALRAQIVTSQIEAAGYQAAGVLSRVDIAELLDDHGTVDPLKVSAAIETAAAELGLARRPTRPAPVTTLGSNTGGDTAAPSWSEALRPNR